MTHLIEDNTIPDLSSVSPVVDCEEPSRRLSSSSEFEDNFLGLTFPNEAEQEIICKIYIKIIGVI